MPKPTTFPWRELLAGDLRGASEADLRARCGEPDTVEGDLRIYRVGPGGLGASVVSDPRLAVAQFWMVEGVAANAALHLEFADGLKYDEVLW